MSPRGRTWRSKGAVLSAMAAALLFGCTADVGTAPTELPLAGAQFIPAGEIGYDLNDFTGSPQDINGAIWTYPVPFNVGTGRINPFLSVQNAGMEEAFNTNNGTPLDATRTNFHHALALSDVPIIRHTDGMLYREFIFDANESNSTPDAQFSIDFFDLYLCEDLAGTVIPEVDEVSEFSGSPDCQIVYDFEDLHIGFATDAATQGSGSALDYYILIPEINFDAFNTGGITTADCPYSPGAPCGLWLVLHTKMGGVGGDWVTGATFEEYSTLNRPFVTVDKTAVPEFSRNHTWDIAKTVTPTDINLFDGQSQDAAYTVTVTKTGTVDSGWQVSGQITLTNSSAAAATVTSIIDKLQPGDIPVTLSNCATPFDIAVGATVVCDYTHGFGSDPGAGEFMNTVEIEIVDPEDNTTVVSSGTSATFAFTSPTTETNKTVDVTDLFEGTDLTTLATGISTGDIFNYSRTFTCNEDDGGHPNTAKVLGDGGAELDEASANVNVNCLDLTVTKDAATALERTYLWDISKTVTPETWDLFDGDDGTSDYDVTVTPNGVSDAGWSVSGNIMVSNPNTVTVYITNIADAINGIGAVTVTACMKNGGDIGGPSFADPGHALAAGETITCAYTQVLPDDVTRTNTATATARPTMTGGTKDFSGQAAVDFTGVVLTEVNKDITVDDNVQGALGGANHDDGPTSFNYSRQFFCGNDEGTHDNIATIVETGQNDNASVVVNCHQLAVTKTADTEWTRTWTWSIDKDIDATHFAAGTYDVGTNTATVMENTALEVKYDITLDATSVNSMRKVAGIVTVSNAGNPIAATINTVTDVVSVGMNATVDCGVPLPTDIAAGGSLDCAYGPLELPDLTQRVNTGTATQQNFSYASDGVGSNSGTTDYAGMADVIFAADPTFEIDECVNVVDLLKQGGVQVGDPTDLGQLCAGSNGALPHTFTVLRTFGGAGGIPLVCGDNVFDNMGMFTTNDTGTQGQDPATINIFVECIVGCTLTQGYWKTHNDSFHGGASKKADLTWGLIGPLAEQETFFLSGDSWYDVFWTAPKGNAYYNLAHQWMAAHLNTLAGATAPPEVVAALADAQTYFENNTPADAGALKGKAAKQLRDWASTLGAFNEGLIGPGHCTEN